MLSMFKTVPLVPVAKNVVFAVRLRVALAEEPEENAAAEIVYAAASIVPRVNATVPVVVKFLAKLRVCVDVEPLIVRFNGTVGEMSSTCVAGGENDWLKVHVPVPMTVRPEGMIVETETPVNP
jgi:hypothetical protein